MPALLLLLLLLLLLSLLLSLFLSLSLSLSKSRRLPRPRRSTPPATSRTGPRRALSLTRRGSSCAGRWSRRTDDA